MRQRLQQRCQRSLSQCRYRSTTAARGGAKTASWEDPALAWGRANAAVAEQCLQAPPFPINSARNDAAVLPATWPEYFAWRNWQFPGTTRLQDLPHAQALATHVLSTPMTLAYHLLTAAPDSHDTSKRRSTPQRWLLLGARAESQLPLQWWNEVLYWRQCQTPLRAARFELVGIGPEVTPQPSQTVRFSRTFDTNDNAVESTIKLSWERSPFHHSSYAFRQQQDGRVATSTSELPDVIILLNPGLGHEHLRDGWRPTLPLLFDQDGRPVVPILLTAHSPIDAARDADVLRQYCSVTVEAYGENPYASRICYQDPLDMSHLVRPNHYVTVAT